MNYFIVSIISYLIGSISGSLIISKLFFNEDIRKKGSGNAGGTNAVRVYGKKYGSYTILIDTFKATLVVAVIDIFFGRNEAYIAGIAVVIGHIWPIYYGFRGGKGVATIIGTYLYLNPIIFLIMFAIFVIINYFTDIVSMASILSISLVSIIFIIFSKDLFLISMLVIHSLLVIFSHRENLKRIINGNENKINLVKKIFGRNK